MIVLDERFRKINRLLSLYSLGKFDNKIELSPRLDEIDAFIAGVNMLGEELKAITISRNYFTNIFNSVSDMVFILDKKGFIEHINNAAANQLEYAPESLTNVFVDELQIPSKRPLYDVLTKELKKEKQGIRKDTTFLTASGKAIPVRITAAPLVDPSKKKSGILLTARDITHELKTEKLVIRAIIDTQEKEQRRLAQDLHDSLGQELSAIKFYISSIMQSMPDEEAKEILAKSNDALMNAIKDMRDICFNLMPKTLEEFGLPQAVQEMCNKVRANHRMNIRMESVPSFPQLSKELQIDIYRVFQEFINNTLKHANASSISVKFSCDKDLLKITMQDNGKGFEKSSINPHSMGLQNVRSRVKSHNGDIIIESEPGKGTKYLMEIPLKN